MGIVPTDNFNGYDLVGNDGGVFVFPVGQSSGFFGSLPGMGVHVNDIVGIVATPGGGGYFLVGKDGGVFTFGDAPFFGSLPGIGVSVSNITGIASTPDGNGYYLVGADGAVYAFGARHQLWVPGPGSGAVSETSWRITDMPFGQGLLAYRSDGSLRLRRCQQPGLAARTRGERHRHRWGRPHGVSADIPRRAQLVDGGSAPLAG